MATPPRISGRPATSACTSNPCPILILVFLYRRDTEALRKPEIVSQSLRGPHLLEDQFGKRQILRISHLEVGDVGSDQPRLHSQPFDRRSLIGDVGKARGLKGTGQQ